MGFRDLKVGDTVTRMLAGKIPMKVVITQVDDNLITCAGGWTFDRNTGVEEDEYLEWGVKFGVTGSYLALDKEAK